MIKLRCVVEHITYQNQENGWSVMKVKVKGYDNLVTLTGSLLDVPVGSVLLGTFHGGSSFFPGSGQRKARLRGTPALRRTHLQDRCRCCPSDAKHRTGTSLSAAGTHPGRGTDPGRSLQNPPETFR